MFLRTLSFKLGRLGRDHCCSVINRVNFTRTIGSRLVRDEITPQITIRSLRARTAHSRSRRSSHLSAIVKCLEGECQPFQVSSTGFVRAFAWKTHSYQVISSELARGADCCANAPVSPADTW